METRLCCHCQHRVPMSPSTVTLPDLSWWRCTVCDGLTCFNEPHRVPPVTSVTQSERAKKGNAQRLRTKRARRVVQDARPKEETV